MSQEKLALAGLGYVGIEAPDPLAWRSFAVEVCGLTPSRLVPGPRSNRTLPQLLMRSFLFAGPKYWIAPG